MRELTVQDAEDACLGGGVLACGGGGWLDHGLQNGRLSVTLGRPKLVSIDEVPQDGLIITITAIGAPASDDFEMWPKDYIKAFELVREAAQALLGRPVVGVMNAQNGYSSSVNCWMPAAAFDLPVVDAAGDVRAHPTIKLGAMGYASEPHYQTVQAVVGGKRAEGAYLEVVARGSLLRTANILRAVSVQAGGFIASARLPLPVTIVKERAALGAISTAIELGAAIRAAQPQGGTAVTKAITRTLGGEILALGEVTDARLYTQGGFDHAQYTVQSGRRQLRLWLMNEFMAADVDGERHSTFPDTLSVLDAESGLPLKSAEIKPGRRVAALHVDHRQLPLGQGVLDRAAYPELEAAMGIDFQRYVFPD